ncbi:MAG TPA: glycosyltransferase family 2 protein [Bacteroidales bacterium]|nr:glycosyltransferase family 2 protein [Bacteroidales bacterium]
MNKFPSRLNIRMLILYLYFCMLSLIGGFIIHLYVMVKISIIVPVYNAGSTLSKAVRSIQSQSFRDFECFVVDNASTDGSDKVARELISGDPRFHLLYEQNKGVVPAFLRGLEKARGIYVARMDADDFMYPQRLARQYEFLEKHCAFDAVGGLVKYRGTGTGQGGFRKYVEWNNTVVSYEQILNQRFVDAPVVNPTAMWRRSTGESLGTYRMGDFPEDYEMWLRWLEQGVKIGKVAEVVLDWWDSSGRLTRSDPAYSDQAFYRVKTLYLARWLERYNPFHPNVAVWGASRTYRQRSGMLEPYGIHITRYIDIRKERQLPKPVIYYEDLPEPGAIFVLVYVRQWHAKDQIVAFLYEKGYTEGVDYLLVS